MSDEPLPEWFYPPMPGGWTAADLDRLPGPSRFELIDGALVLVPPQTSFHSLVTWRLADVVESEAPAHLRVAMRMTVTLGRRQRPEPDVMVVDAPYRADRTAYAPDQVLLVAEVVSEESAERDRLTKPLKYAAAGIRHFWRVENEDARPVAYVHELDDTTAAYVATGVHRGRLKVDVPFPMDIDLAQLTRR